MPNNLSYKVKKSKNPMEVIRTMFNYFLAENMKVKHSFFNKLIYIAPILVVLASFLAIEYIQVDMYNWWYLTMLPGTTALSCCLLSKVDESMNYRAVLSLNLNLKKVWISKVLVGIKSLVISCLIIFVCSQIVVLIFNESSIKQIPMIDRLFASMFLIITFMWQIPLIMFIGSKFGLFLTVPIMTIVNIVCSILSIEKYWFIIPFSYPARLMCPVLKVLPNGLLAVPESETFSQELLSTSVILYGVIISIILFIVVTYLTSIWFEKKEAL